MPKLNGIFLVIMITGVRFSYRFMRQYRLLHLGRNIENNDYIETAEQMALYHHEKWNGTGYPMGLAGEQIPLCARIMAVVDVFDALTSKRVYKDAFSVDKAIDILKESSGSHFEPELVDEFIKIRSKIEKVFEENSD